MCVSVWVCARARTRVWREGRGVEIPGLDAETQSLDDHDCLEAESPWSWSVKDRQMRHVNETNLTHKTRSKLIEMPQWLSGRSLQSSTPMKSAVWSNVFSPFSLFDGFMLNRPSHIHDEPNGQWTELNWTEKKQTTKQNNTKSIFRNTKTKRK